MSSVFSTIEILGEVLADFDEPTINLPVENGGHLPYMLDGPQVGAVKHLLWKAKTLARKESDDLKQILAEQQALIDQSIEYLDPHVE
jgi:hypothetical protein